LQRWGINEKDIFLLNIALYHHKMMALREKFQYLVANQA